MNKKILLVGAGPMAIEYAKILKDLKKDFLVVGRSQKSADNFEAQTGLKALTGGIDKLSSLKKELPKTAIVAVSEEQLGATTIQLLRLGVQSILVEKPGGMGFEEIKNVNRVTKQKKARVYVGYNRRFYSSVQKAQEIIKKDGGVLSCFFDFTEATFRIEPLIKGRGVKEDWFLQNSTHVIDMAFFMAGMPKSINSEAAKSLSWHKKGAIFVGSGKTKTGALFSYISNWISPGRWAVEIMTKRHKLIFRPLEKLQIQDAGTFAIRDFPLEDKLDLDYKPGLYKQVQSFLGNKKGLCAIEEQVTNLKVYQRILTGS